MWCFFTYISHQDGHQPYQLSLRCQGYLTLLSTPQVTAPSIHSYPGIHCSFEIRDKELFYKESAHKDLPQADPFYFLHRSSCRWIRREVIGQVTDTQQGLWIRRLGFTSGLCDLPAGWHWTCRLCPESHYPFVSSKSGPHTRSMSISWVLVGNTEILLSLWTHWLLTTV